MADPYASKHPAHALLLRAHSPSTAAALFTSKVQHKPLILRPTSPDPSAPDARAARRAHRLHQLAHRRRRAKPRPLSARERRMLGVHDVPPAQQSYALYRGLHTLWVRYVWEILGLRVTGNDGKVRVREMALTPEAAGPKLASADWHGARVQVVRSPCVGRVGAEGIVVKDTKFTFVIVTETDKLLTIPKKDVVFRVEVPRPIAADAEEEAFSSLEGSGQPTPETLAALLATWKDRDRLVFEIYGSQFQNKPVDRATKKFKVQRTAL